MNRSEPRLRRLFLLAAAVGLSAACASPSAKLGPPSVLTEPTQGSKLEIADGKGTLTLHQDFLVAYAGEFVNNPTGEGTITFTMHFTEVDLGDVQVKLDEKLSFESKVVFATVDGTMDATSDPLEVRLSHDLPASVIDALTPLCGTRQSVWLKGTWESTPLNGAPAHLSAEAAKGEIANLLTQPEIEVQCATPPEAEDAEGAEAE